MVFFAGKNGYTRPVDFVPVPDPTRKTSIRTRPIPAGTGLRVDPHTSSANLTA